MNEPTGTALATRPQNALTPDEERARLALTKDKLQVALASGLMPKAIKNVQQAMVLAWKGGALGLDLIDSMQQIHVIDMKPTLSAELMRQLILDRHGPDALQWVERSTTRAAVLCRPKGRTLDPELVEYTIEDARAEGLLGKDNWKKMPRKMLTARCTSEAARLVFPECLHGCYTPEELGAEVAVDSEGAMEFIEGEIGDEAQPEPTPTTTTPAGKVADANTGEILDSPRPTQPAPKPPSLSQRTSIAALLQSLGETRELPADLSMDQARELIIELQGRVDGMRRQPRANGSNGNTGNGGTQSTHLRRQEFLDALNRQAETDPEWWAELLQFVREKRGVDGIETLSTKDLEALVRQLTPDGDEAELEQAGMPL